MINTIERYFELGDTEKLQFTQMIEALQMWNERINVVSRKDIDNLEINHVLHSLAIAKFIQFTPNSEILDFGTGGGLPGLPLAIIYPQCRFHLIDRIGKKVKVAKEVADAIGINNVTFQHGDIAECKKEFDFVVSRGVMELGDMIKLCRKNISRTQRNAIPNGIITLKGGDLTEEIRLCGNKTDVQDITCYFTEPFFETKRITYTPIIK